MSPMERQGLYRNIRHHVQAIEPALDSMLRDATNSAYELGVIAGASAPRLPRGATDCHQAPRVTCGISVGR
jgi:hypothetical protein